MTVAASMIQQFREAGVDLCPNWLNSFIAHNASHSVAVSTDAIYQAFVFSDFRESCTIPPNSLLNTHLRIKNGKLSSGCYVFQITSFADISIPLRDRPRKGGSQNRLLKMILHCGDIHVIAIEAETIKDLPNEPDIGLKLLVFGSPVIQNGILMLRTQHVQVIGGEIPQLNQLHKAATQKAVASRDMLIQINPENSD